MSRSSLSYPTPNPGFRVIWEKPPGPRVPAQGLRRLLGTKTRLSRHMTSHCFLQL